MIDLKPFCVTDATRSYLEAPFSHGEFTYATNGHIMVRLPRLPDIPDIQVKGNWSKPFEGLEAAMFAPLRHGPLPTPIEEPCSSCGGDGHQHSCSDCTCVCEDCGGAGKENVPVSTTIAGDTFNLRYIALALTLPGIEFMTAARPGQPFFFKFNGGVGALMPMRSRYKQHVEIEIDKAA